MSGELYELVFYGDLEPGADLEKTKAQLALLFKASVAQVEKMFSGQRVVLKAKLDAAAGDKYLAALKARGAQCKLEPVARDGAPPVAPKPEPAAEAVASAGATTPEPSAQPTQAPLQSASPKTSTEDISGRMDLAGEKANEVLEHSSLGIEPLGVDLGVKDRENTPPELTMQDSLSIAPVGVELVDKKDEPPAPAPDVSHLKLED